MKVIKNIAELKTEISEAKRSGKKIGLVPTMGALHQGHKSLVEQSVAGNDYTVVSVFVNPTQFNNADDLVKYPRDLEKDATLLEGAGVDLVFAPQAEDIYSTEELHHTFEFDFNGLDKVMEGAFRPGHFNGVVQIVSKLFDFVEPDKAYFGEKDFQQLAIIHLLVKQLNYNVEIVDCSIVREQSGLAMSSRNERLTAEQRKYAAEIYRVLNESSKFVNNMTPGQLKNWVCENINKVEGLNVEYFEIANSENLQPVSSWEEPSVGCIAVFCGDVRLIDNIRYNVAK